MRRAWCLLPALSSVAACFPSRDNIHDPQRRPDAELVIVDTRQIDGTCGSPAGLTSSHAVVTISDRRECIGLRAVGSSDPQGTDVEYRFAVKSSGDFAFLDAGYGIEPGLLLTTGHMYSLAFGANLFRVYVRDEEGSVGTAEAVFAKANAAPVALAETSFEIPVGGVPWALGEPVELVLSGEASFDPNGDPLQYCWNDLPCGSDPTRTVTMEVDAPARKEAKLRVFDGASYSSRVRPSVSVRRPDGWLIGGAPVFVDFDTDATGFFELVEVAARRELPYPLADYRLVGERHLDPDGDLALLHFGGGSDNYLAAFDLADGSLLEEIGPYDFLTDGGGAPRALTVHPGGSVVWMVSEGLARPVTIDRTTDAVTLTSGDPVDVVLSLDWGEVFADADANGNLWIGQAVELPPHPETGAVENTFRRITPSGEITLLEDRDEETPTAIASRPVGPSGAVDTWTVFRTDPASTSGGLAELRAFDSEGTRIFTTVLPGVHGGRIGWIDHTELWLALGSGELLRLDAEVLAAGAPLDDAVIGRLDDFGYVLELRVDRSTGVAWSIVQDGLGIGTRLARVTPDLVVHENDSDGSDARLAFIDATGEAWFVDDDGPALGTARSLDASRVLSQVTLPPTFGTLRYYGADAVGGLWTMAFVGGSSTLVRLGADGTVGRLIDRVRDASSGEVRILPDAERIAVAPDGTTIWLAYSYFDDERFEIVSELLELDVTVDPPIYTMVGSGQVAEDARVGLFVPSAPDGTRRWSWSSGNGGEIHLTDGGSLVESFTLPGEIDFPIFWGALAPVEDAVCLTTRALVGGSQGEIRSRILHSDGSMDLVDTRVMPDYYNDLLTGPLASTTSAEGEACWFVNGVVDGGWQIRVVGMDGTSIHRLPNVTAGNPTSVFPIGLHSAWMTVSRNDGNGNHAVRMLVEFPPVVGSSNATITEIEPSIDGQFVSPFSDAN